VPFSLTQNYFSGPFPDFPFIKLVFDKLLIILSNMCNVSSSGASPLFVYKAVITLSMSAQMYYAVFLRFIGDSHHKVKVIGKNRLN
jgi:hypothetical protein